MDKKMQKPQNDMVKKVRLKRGLSQEQMAKDLGVTSNYISLIENNKKNAGMKFLIKLSSTYDVPLILLKKEVFLPEAKTKKEKEIRIEFLNLFTLLENNFLTS